MTRTRTVILVVTEDWYVVSHRLPLVRAAVAGGWRVIVATRIASNAAAIRDAGAEVVDVPFVRAGRQALGELATVRCLLGLYRRERPALVHHVGLKPILYGMLAARLANVPVVVNAFAGLGYLYADASRARPLRAVIERSLRLLLSRRGVVALVQNAADAAMLRARGLVPDPSRIHLIAGCGVDLAAFPFMPESPGDAGEVQVVLPARMLSDKGVGDFVQAARILWAEGCDARCILVGPLDPSNPAAIPEQRILQWVEEGAVEWWRARDDMAAVYQQAGLIVLPSYREGLPKVLLEAGATGRAVVTTDVPGCRDVVGDGWSGVLVPPRDPIALAAAIGRLVVDPAERARMGTNARERVVRDFCDTDLAQHTVDLYRELTSSLP